MTKDFDLASVTVRSIVMNVPSSRDPAPDGNLLLQWRRRWLGSWPYWGCQIAGWGGVVVWNLGLPLAFGGKVTATNVRFAFLSSVAGLAVTHLLRVLLIVLRASWTSWRMAVGVTSGILLAIWAMAGPRFALRMKEAIAANRLPPQTLSYYFDVMVGQVPPVLGWVALYFAFIYYRDYRKSLIERLRLEAAIKDAELRVLKAQINPHFLFNCLNSTWAMIPKELERPRESLTLLADLLRAALTLGEKKTVSFRQEWETVQTYLALERIRFEQRLRVRHAIDPATAEWPVPPFLLQTLVENAVKFGVRPRDEGGEIGIEAFVREATLHFRVTNPGRLAATTESTGVGLKNSRDRLRHLFGDDATLTLAQAFEDSVVAEVTIRAPGVPSSPGPIL